MEEQNIQTGETIPKECFKLKKIIRSLKQQLEILEEQRDLLLGSKESNLNIDDIDKYRLNINDIKERILENKTLQKKFRCPDEEKPEITNDSQTIISTSIIKRKPSDHITFTPKDVIENKITK
jgi:hypothetical protein